MQQESLRRNSWLLILTLTAGVLLVSSFLLARTITVDDDGPAEFQSIQAAIDDPRTVAGDVVSVAPGTYFENLVLKCGVSVEGAGYSSTTVDGRGAGPVATIVGCDSATRLQGFTLTNGFGGGVRAEGGAPIITLNRITGNRTGVSLSYSDAIVSQNLISNNTSGGGITVLDGSPVITRNEIFGNRSTHGAGIGLFGSGLSYSYPRVSNNLITGNTATGPGGGIYATGYCYPALYPSIVNNTIASNDAEVGGGLAIRNGDTTANIFYENRASVGGGGISAAPCYGDYISFNMFFLNSPDSCLCSRSSGSDNLEADPLLVDPAGGDYRLRAGSPAIDSFGGRMEFGASTDDLRGQARPLDGNFDGAPRVDRGAYEYDRDDVLGLRFSTPGLLVWDPAIGGTAYHMYSGGLDSLRRSGLDTCRDREDLDRTDLSFTEARTPPVGSVLAYVVTAVVGGAEGSPGFNSQGLERKLAAQCPACTTASCPSCPVAEICGNDIDDDCDGVADYADFADCPCPIQECFSQECPWGTLCAAYGCCVEHCNDGVPNGSESDVDCGGACAHCAAGRNCYVGFDCISGVCVNFICQ